MLPGPIAAPAGGATLVSRDCIVVTEGPEDEFGGDPAAAVVEMVMRADATRAACRARPGDLRHPPVGGPRTGGSTPLDDDDDPRPAQRPAPVFPPSSTSSGAGEDPGRPGAWPRPRPRCAACGSSSTPAAWARSRTAPRCRPWRSSTRWPGATTSSGSASASRPGAALRRGRARPPQGRVIKTNEPRFPRRPHADVVHRPFQPTGGAAVGQLAQVRRPRPGHPPGPDRLQHRRLPRPARAWMTYRRGIRSRSRRPTALVVISHDVSDDLRRERLPVVAERTFVVENGTDHLAGDEAEEFPAELLARGWAARIPGRAGRQLLPQEPRPGHPGLRAAAGAAPLARPRPAPGGRAPRGRAGCSRRSSCGPPTGS